MVRAYLILNAVLYGAFAAYAFLNPHLIADGLGAAETITSDGLYELRGVYGGVSFGIAVLCLLGGLYAKYARPALLFLLAYTGGYV
ncbi:MAG: hypothetical protein AAGJ50_03845, partial [Pseudomonadota bacterium]